MTLLSVLGFALVAPLGTSVPPTRIVAGHDEGAGSNVRVIDYASGGTPHNFNAYAAGFTGGVRVAFGDLDGDAVPDMLTGAGPGAAPHVKAFSGSSGAQFQSFFAFDVAFTGGVYVAAGDINGDGRADIVVGAGNGAAGGRVRVFDGRNLVVLHDFFAYDLAFTGGVRVAAGDVNGDGAAEIVTGSGPGASAHVKAFDGRSGALVRNFFAYPLAFTGGVFVAAADFDGDGRAELVTGTDSGGAPHVKVFDAVTLAETASFFAYAPTFLGGVRVATGRVAGDRTPDLLTAPGSGASLPVNVHTGPSFAVAPGVTPFAPPYMSGTFVAGYLAVEILLSDGFE